MPSQGKEMRCKAISQNAVVKPATEEINKKAKNKTPPGMAVQ